MRARDGTRLPAPRPYISICTSTLSGRSDRAFPLCWLSSRPIVRPAHCTFEILLQPVAPPTDRIHTLPVPARAASRDAAPTARCLA
ncbi:unnamed protein product [Zymoseptoria tritici ST99CH_3D7]|uniref:Uncharacterized protein n=1 Tax=Zymoseptoria tritici (strain ST99CH_3D7) TaxID=1276538 RepID=A0A1X7RQ93_ZYMT9|nr:unnamed protein product [Zymoseptoria tritici ST99CH_3D7]